MREAVRIDFHTHTTYSHDGFISNSQLERFFARHPDFIIAVTDHNEIAGALSAQREFGDHVIVGEEIKSSNGEIIGLFLQEYVEPGMSMERTIRAIHDQAGLVVVPHPFKRYGKSDSHMAEGLLHEFKDEFDMFETFNARNRTPHANEMALEFASRYRIPQTVGSDAHAVYELGSTYVRITAYEGKETLRKRLRDGERFCRLIKPRQRILTRMQREIKRAVRWGGY